ncbi:MIP family channel protein [Chloroflexota bacterium]
MTIKIEFGNLTSREAWRATVAEFIGVLFLVFFGAGAALAALSVSGGTLNAGVILAIATAFGLAIALMVAATANISGGHINPAVTLGAVITGKIGLAKGGMYWFGQLLGAIVGALLLAAALPDAIQGNLGANALAPGVSIGSGLLLETVITFALVFVVFATAVDSKGSKNLAPLAIGMTIFVGHLVAIPFTGTSMNPARSFGPAVIANFWSHHWIFWLGPLIGGGLAAVVYEYVFLRRQNGNISEA